MHIYLIIYVVQLQISRQSFRIHFFFNSQLLNWLLFYSDIISPTWPCKPSDHRVRNDLFALLYNGQVIFGEIVLPHGFLDKMAHRQFLWAG